MDAGPDANASGSYTLSATFADPGTADAPWSYSIDWGDGAPPTTGTVTTLPGSISEAHTYTTEGGHTVAVTVTDKDGDAGSDDLTVTVELNSAPVADAGGPYTADEGSSIPLSLSATDAENDPLTYTWDLGDGATGSGPAPPASHTWSDDGSYTITLVAHDGQLGSETATANVVVSNVAPTATFSSPLSTDEGSPAALSLTSPQDPSPADVAAGFEYAFDCDDGAGYGPWSGVGTASCPAPDDGSRTIRGRIRDRDGGETEYTAPLTIVNVAPVLGALSGPIEPVMVGTPLSLTATYTDPGVEDTHDVQVDWDMNGVSASSLGNAVGGTAGAEHTYSDPGVYAVSMTVTDDDDGSDTSVYEYIVVYDPSGGFVTGGGWIDSPAGAYTADPGLSGKATFGFVARYRKGANTPDGNTEFQFRAGDLTFKSTSYDWLVVAGQKAMFKGVGEINGVGGYGFILSANDDGQDDTFRIRITGPGGLVYDNEVDADEDVDPTTVLGGGSILVHSAKGGGNR